MRNTGWLGVGVGLVMGVAQAPLAFPAPVQPGAAGYLVAVQAAVDGIEKQLPAIQASAEEAAKRVVATNQTVSVWGDRGFIEEALGRAGGLARVKNGRWKKDAPICEIMLVAPKEDKLADSVSATATNRRSGGWVIGFGRADLLAKARQAGGEFDVVIDTSIASNAVPLDPAAQNAALWIWSAEFVSACTRLGAMPTMLQSIQVPGAKERNAALRAVALQPVKVDPVPAGQLAAAYIKELRARLAFLGGVELTKIEEAGRRAAKARREGKTAYVYGFGHSVGNTPGRPGDPGLLARMDSNWAKPQKGITLKAGDFVVAVGYDALFRGDYWSGFADKARQAGVGVAWSFTDYRADEVAAVAPGELWINQHWALGDAEVVVPGYDVKILPVSGVLAETILGMIEAEMMK